MTHVDDEAVRRFRRRTRGTDDATLYRNLEAGVYGPVGSRRRAVAERALQERFSEAAVAVRSAGGGDAEEAGSALRRARRLAQWSFGVAMAALLLALLSLGRAFGLF